MEIVRNLLVAIVAIEHVYILILEMFLWTSARGQRVFGTTPQFAQETRALGANQGLYNGFLAAGLIWGLVHGNAAFGHQIQLFFLICVSIAAIYGGFTAKKSILLMQGLPAFLALLAVLAIA
ncbi:DUF1304 domain-containing protein [Gorillibacterium timonense]|uniref:DUF1304 domain-containing protein n=1 Tax=Gorillibacterium timonense TaxID=1689269 RepID=UPI00071E22A6|nr:DUF1304 domain-containing protein [Gorillibacterium timonense]